MAAGEGTAKVRRTYAKARPFVRKSVGLWAKRNTGVGQNVALNDNDADVVSVVVSVVVSAAYELDRPFSLPRRAGRKRAVRV